MKPDFTDIKEVIDRHLPIASLDEAKAAGARVRHRLQTPGDRARELERRFDQAQPAETSASVASAFRRKGSRWVQLAAAAVLVIAAAIGSTIMWPADPALYRVVEGDVRVGETIRSNGDGGAVLELADTSRIEMRSHSELSLEQATDGVRIRLASGGIIVNAATQRTGHLYVQTKDMTVSVVGTVFVVNADEAGSRVAVIEGEVRVQQGATETKLRPGEQVASSPKVETFSVASELAWSRRAESWLTLLQKQAAAVPGAVTAQKPEARVAFEVESIRPRQAAGGGGGRGGGVFPGGFPPACGATLKIDPRRFLATNITVYELITLAYDRNCEFAEETPEAAGLTGGPEWIRTQRFDIEALRPADGSDYTANDFGTGTRFQYSRYVLGSKLRTMLQTLLAERFNLVLRREMREMTVYELSVARGGPKLVASKETESFSSYVGGGGLYEAIKNGINSRPEYNGLIVGALAGTRASMAELSVQLARMTGRQVIDRTGINGEFTYEFFFAPGQFRAWRRNLTDSRPQLKSPSLFAVLEDELGLRLEEVRRPLELAVIERVEPPTAN